MESVREMIEKRAYQLFLERGGLHGYHIQDWLQAEKEILTQFDKRNDMRAAKKAPAAAPAIAQSTQASAKKRPIKKKTI